MVAIGRIICGDFIMKFEIMMLLVSLKPQIKCLKNKKIKQKQE